MQSIRIMEIPACRMVASEVGMFGDGKLERFDAWFSRQPRGIYPRDYLCWDDSNPAQPGFRWLYLYEEGMVLPEGATLLDFPGGLYAVATDIDQRTDMQAMNSAVDNFLQAHNLHLDPSRTSMGHIISSPLAQSRLGYNQMDYYFPIV